MNEQDQPPRAENWKQMFMRYLTVPVLPVAAAPVVPALIAKRGEQASWRYVDAYLDAAGIRDGGKSPLFRSSAGRIGTLTATAMNRVDAWRMVQRRAADMGMRLKIGCHTFRATGITSYLEAGGTLPHAQAMAAYESPRTTKLYDRTSDAITLDEIERIMI